MTDENASVQGERALTDDQRLFELLRDAIPPAGVETWAPTELTATACYAAIEQLRDPRYPPTCGSSRDHPHVFHPQEIGRLIPAEELVGTDWEAYDWAFCANCGRAFPLRRRVEVEPS